MVKLYKRIDDNLFYAECWASDDAAVTHYGIVGNNGKSQNELCADEEYPQFEAVFAEKYQKQGYVLCEAMPQYTIIFQLEIKDIEMAMQIKDSLTDELNNALGWAGVGHVDGYDVDVKKRLFQKSYLRIFCVVVNSESAKSVMKMAAMKCAGIKYTITT